MLRKQLSTLYKPIVTLECWDVVLSAAHSVQTYKHSQMLVLGLPVAGMHIHGWCCRCGRQMEAFGLQGTPAGHRGQVGESSADVLWHCSPRDKVNTSCSIQQ